MKQVTLREYDYLISEGSGVVVGEQGQRIARAIPAKAFAYLDRLLSHDESRKQSDDHSYFLKRTSWQGKPAFQLQSYVGVLQTPCGTQIEILPKAAKAGDSEDNHANRRMLIRMLRYLRDASFKIGGDVHLKHDKMHLLELFIGYFLSEVSRLVKQGIRSEYVTREENQMFLKGKLLVNQQVRVNAVQQQRFYVAYDEYLPDRPENRLLRAALEKVSRLTRTADNQRLCRELTFVFSEVPVSRDIQNDFSRCKFNRAMVHYRHALEWCRIILKEESAVPSAGKTKAISILFPMEKVFEDYVAAKLRQVFPEYLVKSQSSGKSLATHEGKKIFAMRPDIIIENNNHRICIADTKWKLIDQHDRLNKYGISQSDMYQLYAYAKKFNCTQVVLIYPRMLGSFDEALEPFDFGDDFMLDVIPFPLDIGEQKHVESIKAIFSRFHAPA